MNARLLLNDAEPPPVIRSVEAVSPLLLENVAPCVFKIPMRCFDAVHEADKFDGLAVERLRSFFEASLRDA